MCATMLMACALSAVGLVGSWWGKTVVGKVLFVDTAYAVDISLWKVKSRSVVAIDGGGVGSSSSASSLDELCEHITDQSSDDQKQFCRNVVVIRVFSVLGLITAVSGLISASLLASSLLCKFPWKAPPSSLLLLVVATKAGFIAVFSLISIIIAASMKEDGFSSSLGFVVVKSSDFGVRGVGFVCSVILFVVGVIGLTCGLVARNQVQKETTTRQVAGGPTILGNVSNAMKQAVGAQNV